MQRIYRPDLPPVLSENELYETLNMRGIVVDSVLLLNLGFVCYIDGYNS